MVMTDPIGDMLARVKNALMVRKKEVEIPASGIKKEIARILKEEGFIEDYWVKQHPVQETLVLVLKYRKDHLGRVQEGVIRGMKRVSKPGRRIYIGRNELPRVMGGFGIAIISTSRGVMTDKECRRQGVGGEVLCEVW
ncbi:MAG: 30S ribosomal protein S8 [Aquificota bacterium]|uniref:Small ribosomal subunit protein uS8 n=1 Tax=Thermosulfidibacter takaii TaxID=412593 RepID=A0A7C0Y9C7_9BACT|nr:MAG: 30S ribosomal protein S8 [Aquificota bacterium]RLD97825.1 MAG: 30S ribosomal protein S8 [Aquificota bacterium]RLD99511.1 MAG: 30S ribosomal protein S8 [Aquificota bacterium]HDD53236.1 30S ribosomal protein S8 [Thermosulfidibacter takaii]